LEVVEVGVDVRRGDEYGEVVAYWQRRPAPMPSSDLCAVPLAGLSLRGGTELDCSVIFIDDLPVRVGRLAATTPEASRSPHPTRLGT
jgi:hypothetical protein